MFVFLILSSDMNVKTWPLPRTAGLVCAGWGDNQGVITIQTSTMTPLLAKVIRNWENDPELAQMAAYFKAMV